MANVQRMIGSVMQVFNRMIGKFIDIAWLTRYYKGHFFTRTVLNMFRYFYGYERYTK